VATGQINEKAAGCGDLLQVFSQTQPHFEPAQYQRFPGGQLPASAGMTVASNDSAENTKSSFFIRSPSRLVIEASAGGSKTAANWQNRG
jgi:hypothetical protein